MRRDTIDKLRGEIAGLSRAMQEPETCLFAWLTTRELTALALELDPSNDPLQRALGMLSAQEIIFARRAQGLTAADVEQMDNRERWPEIRPSVVTSLEQYRARRDARINTASD